MAGRFTTDDKPFVKGNAVFDKFMRISRTDWARKNPNQTDHMPMRTIIAIDPGETTGVCFYTPDQNCDERYHLRQLETKTIPQGISAIYQVLREMGWNFVPMGHIPYMYRMIMVIEDYRVYAHKADDHKHSNLHTPQFIGALKMLAWLLGIPTVFQMASEAKGWADDQKLEMWGIYYKGIHHARDALRHMVTYQMFGDPSPPHDTSAGLLMS